ncbi:MAG: serine/threonine protein kinase, partial [Thermoanaerobaculia bacterium]
MRRLRGPGLLGRLALALALVGLLPVGFAVRSLIGINTGALIEQAESLHLVAARTTAQQIVLFLDSRLALAVALASDDALADASSAEARQALARSLTAWRGLGVEGLVVVTPTGEEAIRAQLADPPARRRVSAAAVPRPGDDFLLIRDDAGPPVLRIQARLASGAGLLWLICDGTEIDHALDHYELGEQADLMLVSRGRQALIGDQRLVDDFPEQIVDEALETGLNGAKTDFVSRLDGQEFIGAWATVPEASWAVLSRQPLAVAQRVERSMRRRSWWAVGGALTLIGLASLLAYVSVVRPIREVAAAQRRLAGLPATGGAGGNEIGQLRAAFEALERRISDQERLDEVFLGRYQVSDVLGSGAMGTVFRGWDPKLRRPVALKTVRLDSKLKAKQRHQLVERLLSEAVTVARFNHPNIVGVFDVEDHPEGAYVAMELVDGNSLEQTIWRDKRMSPDQVVLLGVAIARALATAHRHGIVHRDVKPANVLLGEDGSIKVTDFGISELLSSLAPSEDVVFGTPGFVPPETLRGKGYDKAGDLFSMGAVLYTCLVGRPPFDGRTVKEVIRRTLFGVVEPPAKLVPEVPPELDELVMSLLRREQDTRPADAEMVAERLDELARQNGYRWQTPGRPAEPVAS